MTRERIRDVVFGVIRSLMRNASLVVNESDSINFKTFLYGDDFGNLFVDEVEAILRIRVSAHDWSKVYTVGDAIGALFRVSQEATKSG